MSINGVKAVVRLWVLMVLSLFVAYGVLWLLWDTFLTDYVWIGACLILVALFLGLSHAVYKEAVLGEKEI